MVKKRKQYRDPITGRFAKRPPIPRDPITGRFIPRQTQLPKPDVYFVTANILGLGRPIEQLKKEYSAMRKTALRRIEALEKSGKDVFYGPAFYKQRRNMLKKLRQFKTDESFLRAYRDTYAWLYESRRSTLTGQRSIVKDTLETLHSRGYDFVNESNLSDFGHFMNAWRKQNENEKLDSERVVILYNYTSAKKIDPDVVLEHFNDYLKRYASVITKHQKKLRKKGKK